MCGVPRLKQFVWSILFLRDRVAVCCSIMAIHFFFMAANVGKCIPNIQGEMVRYPWKILGARFPVNLWSFVVFPILAVVGLLFVKDEIGFTAWLYVLFPESFLFVIYESIATGVVLVNTSSFKRGTVRYKLYVIVLFLVYYILSVLIIAKPLWIV